MDNEAFLDLIRKRRTIRRFTDQKVSDEQVETLLELAMCAPNRLNRQPWHFIIIRDDEVKQQLAGILRIHPYLETASAVIAVGAMPDKSPTWQMDVSAAIENMLLGATAMGLGGAWVGSPDTVLWELCEEYLCDALSITPGIRIPALVAIGHPAQDRPPHGRHDRWDATKVHYGKWEQRKF